VGSDDEVLGELAAVVVGDPVQFAGGGFELRRDRQTESVLGVCGPLPMSTHADRARFTAGPEGIAGSGR